MTTKAQALDHLTDALAGEDVAGEPTVAGAIDKLATMIEDGDISIGGGGDVLIVPIYSDEGTAKCDLTYAEIKQAVSDGKAVFGVGDAGSYGSQQYTFVLSSVTTSSCVFTATYLNPPDYTSASIYAVTVNSDGTIGRHYFNPAKAQ